jgi:hypothetical protein
MTVLRGNNSEKTKKTKKTRGNENFKGSDKCLSTKLTRRKHLKKRKLQAKIRIVFFLIYQTKFYLPKLQQTDVASKI